MSIQVVSSVISSTATLSLPWPVRIANWVDKRGKRKRGTWWVPSLIKAIMEIRWWEIEKGGRRLRVRLNEWMITGIGDIYFLHANVRMKCLTNPSNWTRKRAVKLKFYCQRVLSDVIGKLWTNNTFKLAYVRPHLYFHRPTLTFRNNIFSGAFPGGHVPNFNVP